MAETKTVNWKEIAENSENPEIKAKYELFKAETDVAKQRSLRGLIVALIKSDAASKAAAKNQETHPENVQPEPETAPENVQPASEPEKTNDFDGLSTVEKLKFWKDRITVLENSRLKNETYAQRRALNLKIYEANEQIAKLREQIREEKRAKKLEETRKAGRVSSLALKQAKVEHLIQKGFSLTNITTHPDGVKKDEMKKVIESGNFLDRINEKHHGFAEMWERWKNKFLG